METREPITTPLEMLSNLVRATNAHDLDALVKCFSQGYLNETPAHPARGFSGAAQVRQNWEQILRGVPDIRVEVLRSVAEDDTVWSELEMRGTRRDGSPHLMRGVVIFGVNGVQADWARFYMEPVQEDGSDVNDAVRKAISNHSEAQQ